MLLLQNILLSTILLPVLQVRSWDLEYVGKEIVIPVVDVTQELLYCVCKNCFDERLDTLMKWAQEASMHPQLVISNRADFELRLGNYKSNVFTIVVVQAPDDYAFEIQNVLLRTRHSYLCLVIMTEPIEDMQLVRKVLLKMYSAKFINTYVYYRNVTTQRNEIYGFSYYPHFMPENKTAIMVGSRVKYEFFYKMQLPMNLQGTKFFSPLKQDAPRVIWFRDKMQRLHVEGTGFNVLKSFVQYANGSLGFYGSDDSDKVINMRDILSNVSAGYIRLAMYAYSLFEIDYYKHIYKSYPMLVVDWCLMVPLDNAFSNIFYPLLPFDGTVWLTIIIVFILYNVIDYYWLKHHPSEQQNYILKNFCHFINISPPHRITAESWSAMCIHATTFVYGILLCAFYTSVLGSIVTVTINHFQINTIEDLIAAQLPVLIIDYEYDFLLSRNITLSEEFLSLLRPIDTATFFAHQSALNTSYAYFATGDQWNFVNLQQQYFQHRIFKYSKICFGSYHLGYPMETESPLWRELEYHIFGVHESGLYFYHETKAFEFGVIAGLVSRRLDPHAFEAAGMKHLRIVFTTHIINVLIATVVFLIENCIFKMGNILNRFH